MGDSKRNYVFAQFIFRNFPPKKFKSVLVVADGKGYLAVLLSKKYRVRVIEAYPRQDILRKKVRYEKGWFSSTTTIEEDFVVGMHPDDATGDIIVAAEKNGKRWSIVPCCVKGIHAHGVGNFSNWIKKLKGLSKREVGITLLPISGKNTVLWSR
ncbi:MAG: hypothetical protein ACXAC5_03755 [Promethearchaeota archaeon]|jgi:hypothetical protein